jgi:hypothetical protein
MMTKRNIVCGILVLLFTGAFAYAQSTSSPVRQVNASRIQKANGDVAGYVQQMARAAQSAEQIKQGKFTIIINPLSNGQFEIQVYRMVSVGKKKVMSTFASLYRAGIEYSYAYDSKAQEIRQYHFVCPPNSLTCWANPEDYEILQQFKWGEKFPSKNCSTSVFTSEEYGREYLQATCFSSRDAALVFAQKFIEFVTGNRGLS